MGKRIWGGFDFGGGVGDRLGFSVTERGNEREEVVERRKGGPSPLEKAANGRE